MPIRVAPTPRTQIANRPLNLGGLLVVCGSPLGGKGPLAARLEELLPYAVKLEASDNLATEGQSYLPRTVRSKAADDAERAILRDASALWQASGTVPPLIVVCARFKTPKLRVAAAKVASDHGKRFLLVEVRSAPIRALRRISRLMLSSKETALRIARYENARQDFELTTAAERAELPAITFGTVLSNLEDTADRVVAVWCNSY